MTSRLQNSTRNFSSAIICQVSMMLLGFISRFFFIQYLGIENLGLNGLFTGILTILSLAELGIGTGMVYNMYKPLADKNVYKLQALINLYKKLYFYIALTVGVIGLLLIPFLPSIIGSQNTIEYLELIFLLFLADSVFSYLLAYKKSILFADQKNYICTNRHLLFNIVKTVTQIVSLIVFKNFIIFIAIQILSNIAENYSLFRTVNKLYPFLDKTNSAKLESEELKTIKKDIYALFLSNISRVVQNGSSNIIISIIGGLAIMGIYSNYLLIISAITMIASQLTTSLTGSIGHYIATESKSKSYELFQKLDLLHFYIYAYAGLTFLVLSPYFITLWLSERYLLQTNEVLVIAVNFILLGFLQTFWTFRTTMGLFTQGKYRPVIASLLNLSFGITLGYYFGLIGILLGTTFSRLLVNTWYDPYIILKHGFDKTLWGYLLSLLKRFSFVAIAAVAILAIQHSSYMTSNNYLDFLIMLAICILCFLIHILVIDRNNTNAIYLRNIILSTLSKFKTKIIKR